MPEMRSLPNGFPHFEDMTREELEGAYESATNVLGEIRETLQLKEGEDVKGVVRALRANLTGPAAVYGYAVTDQNENHRELVVLGRESSRREAIRVAIKCGLGAEVHPLYDVGAIFTAPGGKYAESEAAR